MLLLRDLYTFPNKKRNIKIYFRDFPKKTNWCTKIKTSFTFQKRIKIFIISVDGYGSLDRSWARNRTRGPGGGPPGHKKRPDLMTADFTGSGLAQSPLAGPPPDTSSISVMSTLEPLPEAESGSGSRRSPRRDWKPTRLETDTDVVGAMEAIEGNFISLNANQALAIRLTILIRLLFICI